MESSNPTYQWKLNGSNIGGATSSAYTSSSLANGAVVTCVITSNAACANPTTATSNSITVTVNSTVIPTVSIALARVAPIPLVRGNPLTFTATPTNGGSSPIYVWKVGSSTAGSNSPTFTSSNLIWRCSCNVYPNNQLSCASPQTEASNSITITVNPTPVADAGQNKTDTSGGSPVTIGGGTASGGTPPYTYQWAVSWAGFGKRFQSYCFGH